MYFENIVKCTLGMIQVTDLLIQLGFLGLKYFENSSNYFEIYFEFTFEIFQNLKYFEIYCKIFQNILRYVKSFKRFCIVARSFKRFRYYKFANNKHTNYKR